jgi:hypothetical protein
MSFDHRPDEAKLNNVSDFARNRLRLKALVEIEKCDLVCLNCYAVRASDWLLIRPALAIVR